MTVGISSISPPVLAVTGITPDTGFNASDGLTRVAVVTVRGTIDAADSGLMVTVYDGANPIGTTIADASGKWSLAGVTLAQGANSLTAQATNDAGTGTSPAFTATLDTSTTVSPIASSAVTIGTDGKSYINAAHFNGGVATLSGTAEPGDTVVVVDRTGNSIVGSPVVQADGSWTVTVSGLKDGNVDSYVATATDAAGNVVSSRALTFTVDRTANVSIDRTGNYNTITLPWQTISGRTTSVDSGSKVMLFDNGGSTPIGIATVETDGSWRANVYLSGNGTHNIVAKTTDAAGNSGTSATASFQLADQPGVTTLASFNNAEVSSLGPLIADAAGNLFGTTRGGGAYGFGQVFEIIKTDTGYAAPITVASFNSLNGSVPTGSLVLDADGNLYGTTIDGGLGNLGTVFKIAKTANGYDSTPIPLVYFDGTNGSDPNGKLVIDANGNLFGTTSSGGANNSGTVFEIARTANGYASAPITLANSGLSYAGLAVDSSGNLFATTGSKLVEFVKTANGYSSTPTILADFASIRGSISVAPTLDSSGNVFLLFDFPYGSQVFKLTKTANGYAQAASMSSAAPGYSVSPPIVDSQGNLFWVTSNGTYKVVKGSLAPNVLVYTPLPTNFVVDSDGNLFATTSAGTVIEINKPGYVPAVAIGGIAPDAGLDSAVVSGTATSGSIVSVYDGAIQLGTTTATANGTWSFTAALAPGANDLTAAVIDAGGKIWTSSILAANLVSSGNTVVSAPTSRQYFVRGAGILSVAYGATINDAFVADRGTDYAGGIAYGTSVLSGGTEIVTGTASKAIVSAGGAQNVIQGGTALGTTVMAGGYQGIDHATATGTVLSGQQQVLAGGLATATVVNAGARQYVGAGGTANGTSVNSAAVVYVDIGGTLNGATIAGYEVVLGASTGSTIQAGGLQDDQGLVSGAIVAAGGVQQVNNGGTTNDTTINAGGFQSVQSGGTANGTTLNGEQQVLAGGTAIGTVINAGGREYVGAGGETIGTVTGTNGLQYIDADAVDSSSVVFGGLQYVVGTATGTTVDAGGRQDVGAGGTAVNTYLTDGTEHVYAGGLANGADFDGWAAATLILDDPSLFAGSIVNFGAGDRIDFRDVTDASIDGTGHLNLTTAGGNYAWALLGQYAAADFALGGDGAGGTVLTYQPADTTHTISIVSHA